MQRSALVVTPLENPRVGGSIPPLATIPAAICLLLVCCRAFAA